MNIKKFKVNDIEIAYREKGSGYPLIMIMGYRGTMDSWDAFVINELSKNYRLILFDNRGMGETHTPDVEFSIELFAKDTAGLMKALSISKANVLGFSLGVNVALEMTLTYPEMVNKLILYGGDCGGKESIKPQQKHVEELVDMSGTLQERCDRILKLLFPEKWLQQVDNPIDYLPKVIENYIMKNVEKQFNAMVDWKGAYSRLNQIKQPTLIITGKEDIIRPPINSFMMSEKIENSWLVQLPGAHGLMMQDPQIFSKHVLLFLESCS